MHQRPPSAPRASMRQIWRGRGREGVWNEPHPTRLLSRGTPTGPRALNRRPYPIGNIPPPAPPSTMTGPANRPVPGQSQPPQNPQTGKSEPVHQTSDAKKPFGPNCPVPSHPMPRPMPPNPVPPHPVPPYGVPPYGMPPYGMPPYPMPPYGVPPYPGTPYYGVHLYDVPGYPVPHHHVPPHPVPQQSRPAAPVANYPHYGPYAQPLPGSYNMNHGQPAMMAPPNSGYPPPQGMNSGIYHRPVVRDPSHLYPYGTWFGGLQGPYNGYAQQGQVANVPGAASGAAVNRTLPMHQGVHAVNEGRNPQIEHTGRSETERAVPRDPSALAPTAEPFYPAKKPGLEAVALSARIPGPGKKYVPWAIEPNTGASSAPPVTEGLPLQPASQAPMENSQAATKSFNAGSKAQSEWPQGATNIPQINITLATPTQEELLGCVSSRPLRRLSSVGREIPTEEGPSEAFSYNVHNSSGGIPVPFPPAHRAELLNTTPTMNTNADPSFLVLSHAQSLQRSALHAELRHKMVVEKAGEQEDLGGRSGREGLVALTAAEKRKARKKALDKYALELFEAQKNPGAQAEKQAAEQRALVEFEAEVRVRDPQSIMNNPQHPFWHAPLAWAPRPSPRFPDAHIVTMHAENQELVSAFETAFHNMASFADAHHDVQTRLCEPRARSDSTLTMPTSSRRSQNQSRDRHVPRNSCLVPSREWDPMGLYVHAEGALGHGMTATAHVPTLQMPLPSLTLPSLVDPGTVHQIRVLNPTLPPFASTGTTRNVLVAPPPPPPFTSLNNAQQMPLPNPPHPAVVSLGTTSQMQVPDSPRPASTNLSTSSQMSLPNPPHPAFASMTPRPASTNLSTAPQSLPNPPHPGFANLSIAPQMSLPNSPRPASADLNTTPQMQVPNRSRPAFVNRSTLFYLSKPNLTAQDFQEALSRFEPETPSRTRASSCTAQRDSPVPTIKRTPPMTGLDHSKEPPSPVDRAQKIQEANARYHAALINIVQLNAMQPRDDPFW